MLITELGKPLEPKAQDETLGTLATAAAEFWIFSPRSADTLVDKIRYRCTLYTGGHLT